MGHFWIHPFIHIQSCSILFSPTLRFYFVTKIPLLETSVLLNEGGQWLKVKTSGSQLDWSLGAGAFPLRAHLSFVKIFLS